MKKLWAVIFCGGSEPDCTETCGVFASESAATAYIQAWVDGGEDDAHKEWLDRHFFLQKFDLVETVANAIKLQKKAAKAGPNPVWDDARFERRISPKLSA